MDRINKQVDRITNMVNDILEYTRGSQGPVNLNPEDYGEYLRSIVEELQREVTNRGVTVRFENPPPTVKLALNPPRLNRVFYNLILNAVDEMPGGGEVTVRTQVSDREVLTEITDTGEGIAPEIIDRLFEAFATYGKTKGTGLGLSICQRIVQEHGGRIWAGNRKEGGAVFSFTLPVLCA
jgi:signal transduction histidine kinase